jgi:hypothetical protein
MTDDKQRATDKQTTPGDAQKGGQGGVAKEDPKNQVEEREPQTHKS